MSVYLWGFLVKTDGRKKKLAGRETERNFKKSHRERERERERERRVQKVNIVTVWLVLKHAFCQAGTHAYAEMEEMEAANVS